MPLRWSQPPVLDRQVVLAVSLTVLLQVHNGVLTVHKGPSPSAEKDEFDSERGQKIEALVAFAEQDLGLLPK